MRNRDYEEIGQCPVSDIVESWCNMNRVRNMIYV